MEPGSLVVENQNHQARDVTFGKDACLSCTKHAPINGALCNYITFAIILRRSANIAETRRHLILHRQEAIDAVMSLDFGNRSGSLKWLAK